MTSTDWRAGRVNTGLTQAKAAQQLGISQAYLSQLENGSRKAAEACSRKAADLYGLPPTVLPLPSNPEEVSPDEIQVELAAAGYPGFSHVRAPVKTNPAKVVYGTVVKRDVDTRLVEALPWVLSTYPDLNWVWLRDQVKLRNAQNRLGYLLFLAKQLAASDPARHGAVEILTAWEKDLEDSRLATEGTLCRDSMPEAEKLWLRENRPEAAAHWGLLTSLTSEQLFYVGR